MGSNLENKCPSQHQNLCPQACNKLPRCPTKPKRKNQRDQRNLHQSSSPPPCHAPSLEAPERRAVETGSDWVLNLLFIWWRASHLRNGATFGSGEAWINPFIRNYVETTTQLKKGLIAIDVESWNCQHQRLKWLHRLLSLVPNRSMLVGRGSRGHRHQGGPSPCFHSRIDWESD